VPVERAVLYFRIEPAEIIIELRGLLHKTGLFLLDKQTFPFVPHMTLREFVPEGQNPNSDRVKEIMKLSGGTFECKGISLAVPNENFVFSTHPQISLGSAARSGV